MQDLVASAGVIHAKVSDAQLALRNASAEDFGSIVELNEREVQQTSPMDLERLRDLAQMSSYHKVAVADGRIAAFLLAMREGAPYQNDNYAWFAARFPNSSTWTGSSFTRTSPA